MQSDIYRLLSHQAYPFSGKNARGFENSEKTATIISVGFFFS